MSRTHKGSNFELANKITEEIEDYLEGDVIMRIVWDKIHMLLCDETEWKK